VRKMQRRGGEIGWVLRGVDNSIVTSQRTTISGLACDLSQSLLRSLTDGRGSVPHRRVWRRGMGTYPV
jgi:hypothetical protein